MAMAARLTRFSVSVDSDLLKSFFGMARKHGWRNRSEALRNVMRAALVRDEWQGNAEIVGTVTIVYDHHRRELTERLTSIQHDHHDAVLATTHIHLDHDNCLEMIAVRGRAMKVQAIADALIGTRGVKHGKLTAATTGRKLS